MLEGKIQLQNTTAVTKKCFKSGVQKTEVEHQKDQLNKMPEVLVEAVIRPVKTKSAAAAAGKIADTSEKAGVEARGATGPEVAKWGFAHVDCPKKQSKEKFGTSSVRNPVQVTCKACQTRFRVPAGSTAFVAESAGAQFQYRCTTCHGTVISSVQEGDKICKAHVSPSGKPCKAQFRAKDGVRIP